MKELTIGVHMTPRDGAPGLATDATAIIESICEADAAGVDVAWMTSGGVSVDPLAVFAAAAGRTSQIKFGTSIVPTFPRHPLALVQGAIVVDNLAPGRLRLGVGPSHKPTVESTFGFPFVKPLEHLREYVTILNSVLKTGKVAFDGKRLHAHTELAAPTQVEVLISALRENAYQLAGEITDGAISWVSPLPHIRDVAAPALRKAAEAAGRPPPPIVAHVPVVLSTDSEAVRAATLKQFGFYPRLPYYSAMFQQAGFPEAKDAVFSERMADALVISGDEATVEERLRAIPDSGAQEVVVSVVSLEEDAGARSRTISLLGKLAQAG